MGPPRLRHLVFLALLLLIAMSAFFSSSRVAHDKLGTEADRREQRRKVAATNLGSRPVSIVSTAAAIEAGDVSAPPPPPRRTISLECAKAGPHWNKNLPTTSTSAVELLPFPFERDGTSSTTPPPRKRRRRLQPFAQAEVSLLNGSHLARAEATNLRYLHSLHTDDLLFAWRKNANLPQPPGARPLRGWESPGSELRGHVLGHWLSASALCYATTRDPALRARMEATVEALAACQQENGWLSAFPESFLDRVESLTPVWAPYYTLHKLLQGLLDQHTILGSDVALRCALRLALYIQKRVKAVVERQSLSHHWTTLNKEFGGLNEVLWRLQMLSDEQAGSEANPTTLASQLQLKSAASHFDRPCLLGPLAAGQDTLDHMHANTQLPVLAGAHARFESTGDAAFRQLAAFFVALLLRTRTFATGGSSVGEYWVGAGRLGELVSAGEGTTQESCSTHNMMRLTRGLLMTAPTDGEAAMHADYHERALFNSVLGTQRGDRPGEMLYWLPLGAGVSKMDLRRPHHGDGQQHGWSIPHGDFWCCVGSGLEAFSRLADSTFFFHEGSVGGVQSSSAAAAAALPTLYVVQPLTASRLRWRAAGLEVRLQVDEPGSLPADRPLKLALSISPLRDRIDGTGEQPVGEGGGVGGSTARVSLRLRLPPWSFGPTPVRNATAMNVHTPNVHTPSSSSSGAGGEPPLASLVTSSGQRTPLPRATGPFLSLERVWNAGDALTLTLPMKLRTEPLADTRPRFRNLHAMLCGPLLLAGLTHGPRTIVADPSNPAAWLRPVPHSAAATLRSLVALGSSGGGGGGGYVSAGLRGVTLASGALPASTEHDAPDATWRVVCSPNPRSCLSSTSIALEHFATPGAYLGVVDGHGHHSVELTAGAGGGGSGGGGDGYGESSSPPEAAQFRILPEDSSKAEQTSGSPLKLDAPVRFESLAHPGLLLCRDAGKLTVSAQGVGCSFRLMPPATSYSPLSMWARPAHGRGFLFMPLKDIVDQVYSVYFHVVVERSLAPVECSVLREPWRDDDADAHSPAAVALAKRVAATKGGKWGGVKGLEFQPQGVLKTPWGVGKVCTPVAGLQRARKKWRPASANFLALAQPHELT